MYVYIYPVIVTVLECDCGMKHLRTTLWTSKPTNIPGGAFLFSLATTNKMRKWQVKQQGGLTNHNADFVNQFMKHICAMMKAWYIDHSHPNIYPTM